MNPLPTRVSKPVRNRRILDRMLQAAEAERIQLNAKARNDTTMPCSVCNTPISTQSPCSFCADCRDNFARKQGGTLKLLCQAITTQQRRCSGSIKTGSWFCTRHKHKNVYWEVDSEPAKNDPDT